MPARPGKLEVVKDLNPSHRLGHLQPADRRHDREGQRHRWRLDRRADAEHRSATPSARRRGTSGASPTTRSRSSARTTTAPARPSPDRPRHGGPLNVTVDYGRRHRLHDHEHARDGQARGGQGPDPTTDLASSTCRSTAPRRRPTPVTADRPARRPEHRAPHVGETAGTGPPTSANYQKSIVCEATARHRRHRARRPAR